MTPLTSLKPCDEEIYKDGQPVAFLDARATEAEAWVKKVAQHSGQRVDWHYSGGIAQVLFLGDRQAVLASIEELKADLTGSILRILGSGGRPLYRSRVTECDKILATFGIDGNAILARDGDDDDHR